MLKDILLMLSVNYPQITYPLLIMYRAAVAIDGVRQDLLAGYCEYDGYELESCDGDSYSLEDKIIAYSVHKTDTGEFLLRVIYEGD